MANDPVGIPATSGRLGYSVTIYAMPQPDYVNAMIGAFTGAGGPAIAATAALTVASMAQIKDGIVNLKLGAARKFSRDQTMTTYRRYSIGKNSQQPFQIVPQVITTKLTLERVVLYKKDMLYRVFGFNGETLGQQQIPMMLVEYKDSPNGNLDETALITYLDCWCVTNPVAYDAGAEDQLIVQNIDVECGRVIVSDLSLSGAVDTFNTITNLANNIKL